MLATDTQTRAKYLSSTSASSLPMILWDIAESDYYAISNGSTVTSVSIGDTLWLSPFTYQEQIPWLLYRNKPEVDCYLANHQEVSTFLRSAHSILQQYFGRNVQVTLEVIKYPDQDSTDDLVGWIQSRDDVRIGLEKLQNLEDDWFLKQPISIVSHFNFNLETVE